MSVRRLAEDVDPRMLIPAIRQEWASPLFSTNSTIDFDKFCENCVECRCVEFTLRNSGISQARRMTWNSIDGRAAANYFFKYQCSRASKVLK